MILLLKEISKHKFEPFFNIWAWGTICLSCLIATIVWLHYPYEKEWPLSILEAGATEMLVISTTTLNSNNGNLSPFENFHKELMEVITNYPLAKLKRRNLQKLIRSEYDIITVADKYQRVSF